MQRQPLRRSPKLRLVLGILFDQFFFELTVFLLLPFIFID
jgi:hypothetical protein